MDGINLQCCMFIVYWTMIMLLKEFINNWLWVLILIGFIRILGICCTGLYNFVLCVFVDLL